MKMIALLKWLFCVTIFTPLSAVSSGESSESRDARGKNYVPINSLTIETILKENPTFKASRNATNSNKPWWSDLQTVNICRRHTWITALRFKIT